MRCGLAMQNLERELGGGREHLISTAAEPLLQLADGIQARHPHGLHRHVAATAKSRELLPQQRWKRAAGI